MKLNNSNSQYILKPTAWCGDEMTAEDGGIETENDPNDNKKR